MAAARRIGAALGPLACDTRTVDGGLVVGGFLFALIGAYLFVRSERLTASSFELNRRVLRRLLGDARTDRMLSPSFARANVRYGRGFGVALVVLGAVLVVAGAVG